MGNGHFLNLIFPPMVEEREKVRLCERPDLLLHDPICEKVNKQADRYFWVNTLLDGIVITLYIEALNICPPIFFSNSNPA